MEEAVPCLFKPKVAFLGLCPHHSRLCLHLSVVFPVCLISFCLSLIAIHVIALRVHLDNPDNFPISRCLT